MAKSNSSVAMDLQEAHVALDNDLRELENAIHAGAMGVTPVPRRTEVVRRLARVRLTLTEHFRFEEHNGYMTGVLKREPNRHLTVRELLNQHQQLAQSLDDIITEVRSRAQLEDSLLGKIKDWLKRTRHHESRENQLVQDVYARDTGAED